jgi:hypothetical protein
LVDRWKLVLTAEEMHQVLGLPDEAQVVALQVGEDARLVHVIWEGADLPAGWELPAVRRSAVLRGPGVLGTAVEPGA